MKPHNTFPGGEHGPHAEHGPRHHGGPHERRGPHGHGGPRGEGPRGPRGEGPRGEGPRGEGPRGRGFGRPGGWQQKDVPDAGDAQEWFLGRLPGDWYDGTAVVEVDREEIVVTGNLPKPESDNPAAVEGRIARFRETSRDMRMKIADEAESRYGRKVAWGVTVDGDTTLFTHLAVPVMTRLRQPERKVLDTLVDAGVARSRADALVWAVRLTGEHIDPWLAELREAMSKVDDLRSEGPKL